MAKCISCEIEVQDCKFCPSCGKQVIAADLQEAVAPATVNTSNNNMAMWVHLWAIIGVILCYTPILPIIGGFLVWIPGLIIRNNLRATEFDKRHATQSLNFQLTFLVLFGIFVIGDIILIAAGMGAVFVIYGLATLAIVIIYQILGLIFAIIASVRASKLQEYRYPLSFPFLK